MIFKIQVDPHPLQDAKSIGSGLSERFIRAGIEVLCIPALFNSVLFYVNGNNQQLQAVGIFLRHYFREDLRKPNEVERASMRQSLKDIRKEHRKKEKAQKILSVSCMPFKLLKRN